jgi:hypothetical protein
MERKWDDLYFYKSQLKLHSVSLNTPYTKFKCVNDLIERETSFTIKGIIIKRQSNGRLNKSIYISQKSTTSQCLIPWHWRKESLKIWPAIDYREMFLFSGSRWNLVISSLLNWNFN